MKNQDLPFQIGDHYENWEFDLEVLDIERIKGFDSYTYIKKIVFLGVVPKYVELIFSWDILQCVIMIFEINSLKQQNELFNIDDKLELRLIYKQNSSEVIIIYGYTSFINNLTTLSFPL